MAGRFDGPELLWALGVLEPPSETLVRSFQSLGLVQPVHWRRARGAVRRLTRDLPAFESIWLDALLQARVITRLQAERAEAGELADLAVGPYVLYERLDALGDAPTYRARHRTSRQWVALKRLRVPAGEHVVASERLLRLIEHLGACHHPAVIGPQSPVHDSAELAIVQRFVAGTSVDELLVRRGRFAPMLVAEIAHQLLGALAALHAQGVTHGSIRLANVRLDPRGHAVLVNTGLTSILPTRNAAYQGLTPEAADALAPELFMPGQQSTAASDLYALGCVLWQLLTGRPPYLIADPLAKIAAHQTQTIDPVDQWAPETPERLVRVISALTARDPAARPRSAAETQQELLRVRRAGRGALRDFARRRDALASLWATTPQRGPRTGRWLAAAVCLSGLAVTLSDSGFRAGALSLAQRIPGSGAALERSQRLMSRWTGSPDSTDPSLKPSFEAESIASGTDTVSRTGPDRSGDAAGADGLDTSAADGYSPWPATSPAGVVELVGGQRYRATDLQHAGPLVVRGAGGLAEVDVESAWRISADTLTMEGVSVRRAVDASSIAASSGRSSSLLLVQAQQLTLRQTRWQVTGGSGAQTVAAIAWKQRRAADPRAGILNIENCAIRGSAIGIYVADPPRELRCSQVLKTGPGPLLWVHRSSAIASLPVRTSRATLRGGGPLLQLEGDLVTRESPAQLQLVAEQCVLDPPASEGDSSGPRAALLEVTGTLRADHATAFSIECDDTVVREGAVAVAQRLPDANGRGVLAPLEGVVLEGLLQAPLEFAAAASERPSDSVLTRLDAPRRSEQLPGAVLDELNSSVSDR